MLMERKPLGGSFLVHLGYLSRGSVLNRKRPLWASLPLSPSQPHSLLLSHSGLCVCVWCGQLAEYAAWCLVKESAYRASSRHVACDNCSAMVIIFPNNLPKGF